MAEGAAENKRPEVQEIPHSLEAEQSLLGSVLVEPESMMRVADSLKYDDFFDPRHQAIYLAMLELFEKHQPIDLVVLIELLERKNQLESSGGGGYLSEILTVVPTASHIQFYAEIVRKKSLLRKLIRTTQTIRSLCFSSNDDADTVIDQAESALLSVSTGFLRQTVFPIKEVLTEAFERLDRLHREKGVLRGVPTGFQAIDNLLSGLQPSDFVILAARPSMGKTSLALNIAEHVALEEKMSVAIFSLEMSKEQLVDRLISSISLVDSWRLRTGNLTDDDFPKINYAMGILSEAPLYIDDTPSQTVSQVRTRARRLMADSGLKLIVVDYLQLMTGRQFANEANRVQEISEISRGLKNLARELNIPVLAISQLSRAVEMRSPKIPQLSDLRESGSLEQDADVVAFIYREDYYDPETDRKNIADILIRKHRNGPIGQVELYFRPAQTRFSSIEKTRLEVSQPKETTAFETPNEEPIGTEFDYNEA